MAGANAPGASLGDICVMVGDTKDSMSAGETCGITVFGAVAIARGASVGDCCVMVGAVNDRMVVGATCSIGAGAPGSACIEGDR